MPELHVPSEYRAALLLLADLSEDAITELCKTLESETDVLTSKKVAQQVAAKLKKINPENGYKIIEAIVPLMFTKASHPERVETIVRDIAVALSSGIADESKLTGTSAERFEANFRKLIQLPTLSLWAKAVAVATDVQCLFSEMKILSDIRPVFGEKTTEPPLGAVILHGMRISYAVDGQEKELFVTLDSADLEELMECAARALEKDKTLREFAEKSKLKLFDTSR